MDVNDSEGVLIAVCPSELALLLVKTLLGTLTAITLRPTSTTAFRYERCHLTNLENLENLEKNPY